MIDDTSARGRADQWSRDMVRTLAYVLAVDESEVDAETSLFGAGGTSMHAEVFARYLSEKLDIPVSFTDVFQHPSPRDLAQWLDSRAGQTEPESLLPLDPTAWHAVSESQWSRLDRVRESDARGERLFRSDVEIIAVGIEFEGPLDRAAMTAAVADLVAWAGPLRTQFDLTVIPPQQRERPDEGQIALEYIDAKHLHPLEVVEAVWRGFRLDEGVLARFVLAGLADERHHLWFVVEHLVSDRVTCDLLLDRLAEAYSAEVAGTTPRWTGVARSALEFARIEARLFNEPAGLDAEAHWLRTFAGETVWREFRHPEIAPPRESPQHDDDILHVRREDPSLARRLKTAAARLGSTPHALVVAALMRAAAEVTGDRDQSVYWYTAQRTLPGVGEMVGSLASITMARATRVPEIREVAVAEIIETVASSMAYAFYPIERIARLGPPQDRVQPDDRPFLVVHVNPDSDDGASARSEREWRGLRATPAWAGGRRDQRGYTVDASTRPTDDGYIIGLSYRDGMLTAASGQRLLDAFADELIAIADSPNAH